MLGNEKEIDLSTIDWNNISQDKYIELESKLQHNKALLKAAQPRVKRVSGLVTIDIRGQKYQIKEVLYERLIGIKSQKSKDKLIEQIMSTHSPIDSL